MRVNRHGRRMTHRQFAACQQRRIGLQQILQENDMRVVVKVNAFEFFRPRQFITCEPLAIEQEQQPFLNHVFRPANSHNITGGLDR
jgi:hypothetical protein